VGLAIKIKKSLSDMRQLANFGKTLTSPAQRLRIKSLQHVLYPLGISWHTSRAFPCSKIAKIALGLRTAHTPTPSNQPSSCSNKPEGDHFAQFGRKASIPKILTLSTNQETAATMLWRLE